jgi:N-acetylglucosaminyl-diphospho-decaprenol L-rhamnosyltransferase
VNAVVVDYDAPESLEACLVSLRRDGVGEIVVVENGDPGPARRVVGALGEAVDLVATGRNVGYGAGANRGFSAAASADYTLICNPDLLVHEGALELLAAALDEEGSWAIVGPRILDPQGLRYPSVRQFPSMIDAVGHAVFGLVKPDNRFTSRYRSPEGGGETRGPAGWVSGACFLVRREAFEELGGFDEAYFMFAEDMDLCWRAHQAGWGVGVEPGAVVTHAEGVSRRAHPYLMLAAHHRSALRFANRTTTGWRRAGLPLAALILAVRFAGACAAQTWSARQA